MWFVEWIDPLLIAPFRWVSDPTAAYWLGVLWLALLSFALGTMSEKTARWVNRRELERHEREMKQRHEQSIRALRQGDKHSYDAENLLGNEAFGKGFFLQATVGMSSIWPAFLAAGWLSLRFSDLSFRWFGYSVSFVAPFVVCYLFVRIALPRLHRNVMGRFHAASKADDTTTELPQGIPRGEADEAASMNVQRA